MSDRLEVALPDEALEKGLVDSLIYEDQMEDVFAELGVSDDYDFVTLGDYAAQVGADLKNISADQVAVVYGRRSDRRRRGVRQGDLRQYAGCEDRRRARQREGEGRRAARQLPRRKRAGIDVIWREIELLRAEKPVIVSMGSYAASGGYYISCPADAIVADKMTLTGSIGVFGMFLDTRDALKTNWASPSTA